MRERRAQLCADCGLPKKTKPFRDGYGAAQRPRCTACISKLPSVIEARKALAEALNAKEEAPPTET